MDFSYRDDEDELPTEDSFPSLAELPYVPPAVPYIPGPALKQSEWRYGRRIPRHDSPAQHHVYWLLHNLVAHPLLGVLPTQRVVDFHELTSWWLNWPGSAHNAGQVGKGEAPQIPKGSVGLGS